MAVLFPKKVPAFSRALGEEDDMFDCEPARLDEAKCVLSHLIEFKGPVDEVIVAVGPIECNFVQSRLHFQNSNKVAECKVTLSGSPSIQCEAHSFGSSSIVWLCNFQELDDCFGLREWATKLLSSFCLTESVSIIVLTSDSATFFQHGIRPPSPFLRKLGTYNAINLSNVPELEQPNIISGPSAEIMMRCVFLNLPANIIINFHDQQCGDRAPEEAVSANSPILSSLRGLRDFLVPQNEIHKGQKMCSRFEQMYI